MSGSSLPFLAFLSGAAALDSAPALFDDQKERAATYGDLRRMVPALCGVWPQDKGRKLILCAPPRTIEGAMAFIGASASGHAVLLLDPDATRIAPFVAAYEPEWVVSPSAAKPGASYDRIDCPLETLTFWKRAAPTSRNLPDDLFLLLVPLGPENAVRTVRLSFRNLAANVAATLDALRVTNASRAFSPLPLAYSFGLSVLATHLAAGASVVLTEQDIKSRLFWETALRREANLFAGVPLHYDYIAHAGLENLHAPRLKTFWQAGGRMPIERLRELLRQITARQGAFYVLFGQTEAAPRMAVLALHAEPEKIGSVGKALTGCSFQVENEALVFEGPNVMLGYAETSADLLRGNDTQGRLFLRERGQIDEEGFLFLEGRT